MKPTNYVEITGFFPWKRYYLFFDRIEDRELHRLLRREGVRPTVKKGDVLIKPGVPYEMVLCSVLEKQAYKFEDCMQKRMKLAMIVGDDEYVEFGRHFTAMVKQMEEEQ